MPARMLRMIAVVVGMDLDDAWVESFRERCHAGALIVRHGHDDVARFEASSASDDEKPIAVTRHAFHARAV